MSDIKSSIKWTYIGFFARAIAGLLVSSLLVAEIGMEGYGVFLILSVLSQNGIFQIFDMGIPLYVQKEYQKSSKTRIDHLFSFQLFSILISVAFVSISMYLYKSRIYGFEKYLRFDSSVVIFLIILNNAIGLLLNYVQTRLVCQGKLWIVKKHEALLSVFWVLSCYFIIRAFGERFIEIFLLLYVFAQVAIGVVQGLQLMECSERIKYIFNLRKIIEELNPSFKKTLLPSFLLKLNGMTFKQTDNLIVSIFLGAKDVALLDIGLKFLTFLKTMLGKMNEIIFVRFNRGYRFKNISSLSEAYTKVLNILITVCVGYSIVVLCFSEELLHLWLGNKFEKISKFHVELSSLIALSVPLAHSIPSFLIASTERMSQIVKIITIISLLNILFTIVLIRTLGVSGVIYSTVAQQLLLGYFMLEKCKFQEREKIRIVMNQLVAYVVSVMILGANESLRGLTEQHLGRMFIVVFGAFFCLIYIIKNKVVESVRSIWGK